MKKIKVLQQVIDPSKSGGVSTEYCALRESVLADKYEFEPMVLMQCHNGINLKDIIFYCKKIRSYNPDIIHIRGAGPDGLNAVIAAKISRRGKILVTVHGMYSDLVYINRLKRWVSENIIEKLTFQMADGISCVCKYAEMRPVFKKYKEKMLPFVYNRMPNYEKYDENNIRQEVRRQLQISTEAVVAIYVGRVTKEKGMEYLKDAFMKLQPQWPNDFVMLIVGDGTYLEEFRRCCNSLILNNKIYCLGNQDGVYRFLFASDFFISPSLHENHSIALLEAVAAKKPILATNVGGNAEIVKENGILVDAKNATKLLTGIKTMICENKRYEYQKKIRTSKMEEFEDKNVDCSLDLVYQRIMEIR